MAPAFGINVPTAVWRRTNNVDEPFEQIEMKARPLATIIPPRAGQMGGPRVILRRGFFNEMIEQLLIIDSADMSKADADLLKNSLGDIAIDKLYQGYIGTGVQAGKGVYGTGVVMGKGPDGARKAPWLQIVLTISDETMEELVTMDPLVDCAY